MFKTFKQNIKQFFTNKNAFSLVELIVVIAIMAVMAAVLAPALIGYTERSRAQKDDSAMDELVNSIQLALADENIYDELLKFSTSDNISCYIDTDNELSHETKKVITKSNSDGVDQYTFTEDARKLDEIPYYAAGNMRGTTITFAPNKSNDTSVFDLKQGVINQYVQVINNQRFGAMSNLYSRIKSSIGEIISNNSQTYRNSEYTVFIRIGTTGGSQSDKQDAVNVYGQWSGTNLPADGVSYKIVNDREIGNNNEINDSEWNDANGNKITTKPGDLNGGGDFDENTPTGNHKLTADDFSDDEKDIYAYLVNKDTLVLRNKPRENMSNVTKTYGKLPDNHNRNWGGDAAKIKTVNIETPILPKSCYYWFSSHSNLTKIKNIENLVTDNCINMCAMFAGCNSLESIDLGDFNTSNVTNMQSMFNGCSNLTNLNLSRWNVEKVSNTACMIKNCSNLKTLQLPSNLKKMNNEFLWGCTSLKKLDMPDSIISIGSSAFYNTKALKDLKFSKNLISIGHKCFNESGLEIINLPEGLPRIGEHNNDSNSRQFGWSAAKVIYIPKSVKQFSYSILNGTNLETINYGGTIREWWAIKKSLYWGPRDAKFPIKLNCTDGTYDLYRRDLGW